jgi:hypothetical protein
MKHPNRHMDTQFINPAKAWTLSCVYGLARTHLENGPVAFREEFSDERRDIPTTDVSTSRGGNLVSQLKMTPKATDSFSKAIFEMGSILSDQGDISIIPR